MRLLIFIIVALCAQTSWGFYSPSDDVVELTLENFAKQVINDDSVWIVEFFAPWCGHCQRLVPEYKKLAKAVKGTIKVGSVNADEHGSLGGQYGVKGFPTIKIFGANKRSPIDFNGQRTAKAMAEAALAEVKKKVLSAFDGGSSDGDDNPAGVIQLTDANFDELVMESDDIWLVEFFAPWCGHCRNLEPEWAKAAAELKGKVKLGALDATVHERKARVYQILGYPTIKFFPAGEKSSSTAQNYDGGRTAAEIVAWALDKHANSVPAPPVVEIINEIAFDGACEGKPLCIVSVLPHILDCNANCRNAFLKILKDLGEKYKKKLWGWTWTEGGAQLELEESLEIGGFGYPAMAVVNFNKMKFAVLKGSFSKDGIDEFLRDISYGRGHTAPVRGAKKPNINTVSTWDGKDGQLPQEEEIDLSDVDLEDDKKDKDEL